MKRGGREGRRRGEAWEGVGEKEGGRGREKEGKRSGSDGVIEHEW